MNRSLATYVKFHGGDVYHLADSDTTRTARDLGRALCGATGTIVSATDADELAVLVDYKRVCANCRVQFVRRAAMVASTEPTTPAPPAERSTMTATTTDRKKAASAKLLDETDYADASVDELKAERLTVNNRLSGVNTQIKRKGETPELIRRRSDLLDKRAALASEIASRSNDLAESTSASATLAAATADADADLKKTSRTPARTTRKASTRKAGTAKKTTAKKKTTTRARSKTKTTSKKTAARRRTK